MKIAISSLGESLDAKVDQRFGRTRWLIIYDTEKKDFKLVDNSDNYNAPQGAGIKTATTAANEKCDAVITGNLGPKAFNVLNTTGIKCYTTESILVKDAIFKLEKGDLEEISAPNVKGHW